MTKSVLALSCATALAAAGWASAAPVYLQGYESGLVAPFDVVPDFSGTTHGVNPTTDSITLVTDDGAAGTSQSAELFIEHLAETTDSGQAWQVRFLPNTAGGRNTTTNIAFEPNGYVGYYLKVDPSVTATMITAPVLEDPGTTTATAGTPKTVINDGQWHLYEWNMDDPNDFTRSFDLPGSGIYGNAGTYGDLTLSGTQSFDSIAILSSTPANATIRVDQIGFNNEGSMVIPEPASLGLLGLTIPMLLRRRRGATA